MQVRFLGWEDPLEEGMVTHSSILARRIPWTEEPGGLQSIRLHRVGHDWSNLAWQGTAVKILLIYWQDYLSQINKFELLPCVRSSLGNRICHWILSLRSSYCEVLKRFCCMWVHIRAWMGDKWDVNYINLFI